MLEGVLVWWWLARLIAYRYWRECLATLALVLWLWWIVATAAVEPSSCEVLTDVPSMTLKTLQAFRALTNDPDLLALTGRNLAPMPSGRPACVLCLFGENDRCVFNPQIVSVGKDWLELAFNETSGEPRTTTFRDPEMIEFLGLVLEKLLTPQ